MKQFEEELQSSKIKTGETIRKYIFDLLALVIVLALVALSLDVFGLVEVTSVNLIEFLTLWILYFLAAMLLNIDFYKKGAFVGKSTDKFATVIDEYSNMVNLLSGEQIKGLYPFCEKYNEDAKIRMQTEILKGEGIPFDDFEKGNEKHKPLKTCTIKELNFLHYNKLQILAIIKAKRVKIKGISVNLLLSTISASDTTDIGDNEKTLQNKRVFYSVSRYILNTLLLSMVGLKDIQEWGWSGIILVLFKVAYVLATTYMSYFKGYDNVTINLCNHFTRKTDILKMYLNYQPKIEELVIEEQ